MLPRHAIYRQCEWPLPCGAGGNFNSPSSIDLIGNRIREIAKKKQASKRNLWSAFERQEVSLFGTQMPQFSQEALYDLYRATSSSQLFRAVTNRSGRDITIKIQSELRRHFAGGEERK